MAKNDENINILAATSVFIFILVLTLFILNTSTQPQSIFGDVVEAATLAIKLGSLQLTLISIIVSATITLILIQTKVI